MWKFFKKKNIKGGTPVKIPGFNVAGGDGSSIQQSVMIFPINREDIRARFRDDMSRKAINSSHETALKGMLDSNDRLDSVISEMVKRKYLIERFGKESVDWQFKSMEARTNEIIAQKVGLRNGDDVTVFFDFSKIFSQRDQKQNATNRNDIVFNEQSLGNQVVLRGSRRTFVIESGLFSVLISVGYAEGWNDGKNLVSDSPDGMILKPLTSCYKISAESANELACVLANALPTDLDPSDEQALCADFITFCHEGGFEILVAFKN